MNYLRKNKKTGFTLMELLVVIAVIGILSGVVLQSLGSAREKSWNASRLSNIDQIDKAIQVYFTKNSVSTFPTTANWECIGLSTGQCWGALYNPATNLNAALTGNIAAIPDDPSIAPGVIGGYYLYNSNYSTTTPGWDSPGAYLRWITKDTGSCGRGKLYSGAAGGFMGCALYLGK